MVPVAPEPPRTILLAVCACLTLHGGLAHAQLQDEQLGSISGAVQDAGTGDPIRNAIVSSRLVNGARYVKTRTDQQGRYRLRSLEPGPYVLQAEHPAYLWHSTVVRSDVRAAEKLTGVDFRLERPGVVSGRVTDEHGDPMIGARVQAHRIGRRDGRVAIVGGRGEASDDRGEFRILSLEPGRYVLSATHSSGSVGDHEWQPALDDPEGSRLQMSYVRTYYPGALRWKEAVVFDVAAGQELQGLHVNMTPQRSLSISGQVSGLPAGNRRMAQPTLRSIEDDGPMADYEMTLWGHDGSFAFRGLTPGEYVLTARMDYPPGVNKNAWLRFEITDRPLEGLELQLRDGIAVQGSVTWETDSADTVVQGHVWFYPKGISATQFDTAAQPDSGDFVLNGVLPWTYRVESSGHDPSGKSPPFFLSELRVGGVRLEKHELTIGESPPQDIEIVLARSARISGIVLDENGNPAPGAVILLAYDSTDWAFDRPAAVTDQRGGFQMQGYLPGSRVLYALDRFDSESDDPETLKRLLQGKGTKLEVEKAGEHEIRLKLVERE